MTDEYTKQNITTPASYLPIIDQVHFQLTKHCGLHCWFCGQWGGKGGFPFSSGLPMTEKDWYEVIDDLICYRRKFHTDITVTLWGGDPLLFPAFDRVAQKLHHHEFPLQLVTNGTLIDKHADCLNTCFDEICLAVDGPEEIHDSIHGPGIYHKVRQNMELL